MKLSDEIQSTARKEVAWPGGNAAMRSWTQKALQLEAKLEAMEREVRRLRVSVDARDVTIKTMKQLAAQEEQGK